MHSDENNNIENIFLNMNLDVDVAVALKRITDVSTTFGAVGSTHRKFK